VLGCKNWLFAASKATAHRIATLCSLVQTCRHLQVNPFLYLRDVIERVSTHPARLVLELTYVVRTLRDKLAMDFQASADRFRKSAIVIDFGLSYFISEQGVSAISLASAIRSICGRPSMESRERKLNSFSEPCVWRIADFGRTGRRSADLPTVERRLEFRSE